MSVVLLYIKIYIFYKIMYLSDCFIGIWKCPDSFVSFRNYFFYICTIRTRSYGSWIYNYLSNQCLSPLKLWVRIPFMRILLNTTLCDKVCQWLATGRLFSPGTPVSSTNCHDKAEILLKVALYTIIQTPYYYLSSIVKHMNQFHHI